MKVWDLAKDAALVKTPQDPAHNGRVSFVGIRLRALIDATPTLETTTDANAIGAVKTQLNTELGNANTAVGAVVTRMGTYENAIPTKLLRLDSASIDEALLQKYVKTGFLTATTTQALKEKRQTLIRMLAWSATAAHPQLQAANRSEDLFEVVERRLRLVERMLYEVGINLHQLKDGEIKAAPTGPWRDGASRIFEYPRLGRKQFGGLCQAAAGTGACQGAGMSGWSIRGSLLVHDFKLADGAEARWQAAAPGDDEYLRPYNSAHPDNPPKVAIESIFTPSQNFKQRNMLGCDQVLHLLHVESMMVAGNHRNQSETWFDGVVNSKPARWLRITSPWGCKPDPSAPPPPDRFLVSAEETDFFEHAKVRLEDLQLGDHLIVYNHPIYDRLTAAGVWRLENAIVVQTAPNLLLQGHGTSPLTPASMRQFVIKLLNTELDKARKQVEDRLAQSPNDPGFPKVQLDSVDDNGEIVRRVPPDESEYLPALQKADWWLHWEPDKCKGEMAVFQGPKSGWEKLEKAQGVILVGEFEVSGLEPYGAFFPLWKPGENANGQPLRTGGKYSQINPVRISEPMVATWDWYSDLDEKKRDVATVIRPKVN